MAQEQRGVRLVEIKSEFSVSREVALWWLNRELCYKQAMFCFNNQLETWLFNDFFYLLHVLSEMLIFWCGSMFYTRRLLGRTVLTSQMKASCKVTCTDLVMQKMFIHLILITEHTNQADLSCTVDNRHSETCYLWLTKNGWVHWTSLALYPSGVRVWVCGVVCCRKAGDFATLYFQIWNFLSVTVSVTYWHSEGFW